MRRLLKKLLFIVIFVVVNVPVFGQDAPEPEDVSTAEEQTESDNKPVPPASVVSRSAIKIAPPIDKNKQTLADITQYINDGKLEQIMAGPTPFLVWQSEQTSASAKGVVILFPDWQQNITSPKAINYLRENMSDLGWVTYAVQPQIKPDGYPAPKPIKDVSSADKTDADVVNNTASANESAATDPLVAYKLSLLAIVTALNEEAENYPGILLVIAEGANAAVLTKIYRDNLALAPDAFVLLSAYLPDKNDNMQFSENLAKSHFPVLDLSLTSDNQWVDMASKESGILSQKHIKVEYRQRKLISRLPGYYPGSKLVREIVGWLKSVGW